MPAVLKLSALGMGHGFDNVDVHARAPTPPLPRDFKGSKVEQLLGFGASDANSPSQHVYAESRTRGRRLREMSSNRSLFTDIKNAITGGASRSASRAGARSPIPFKARPKPLKIEVDRQSTGSNDDYDKPPKSARSVMSASTLPSYYYKYSPSSPIIDDYPLPSHPTFPLTEKVGHYTKADQDKILNNLTTNGMLPKKPTDRPRTGNGHKRKKSSQHDAQHGHQRGDSNLSKISSTGFSAYEQICSDEVPSRQGSKASTGGSRHDMVEDHPVQNSGRQSSTVLATPGIAPNILIAGVDSPERERVQTWLTHSALSTENNQSAEVQQEWLVPVQPPYALDHRSSGSMQTLHSAESGTIFPIQGGPGDWDSIRDSLRSRDRQSSLLVDSTQKPVTGAGRTGKVYYTDLQVESVLALSDSDLDSDNESVDSALHRKRLSAQSNGNETQPTAWSSIPSSAAPSRKMSVNTHSTSPRRMSLSSDKLKFPIPGAQTVPMSREASNLSHVSEDDVSEAMPSTYTHARQPTEEIISELPANDESDDVDDEDEMTTPLSPSTEQHQTSSPTLSPLSPSNGPGPVILTRLRTNDLTRSGSILSPTSGISPKSHGPAGPAPARPLPATPTRTPTNYDGSSFFSFPKPPRIPPSPLNLTRSRSKEGASSAADSASVSMQSSVSSISTVRAAHPMTPATPAIRESTATVLYSPVGSPVERSQQGGYLSPMLADPITLSSEEFSPFRLAFPESIRRQMDDRRSSLLSEARSSFRSENRSSLLSEHRLSLYDERSKPSLIPVRRASKSMKIRIAAPSPSWKRVSSPSAPRHPVARPVINPRSSSLPQSQHPPRSSPSPHLPQLPELHASASYSPPLSSSGFSHFTQSSTSDGPRSAPPMVTSHEDASDPEALPRIPVSQIPVPPIPANRPARRFFHLPTLSNASNLTTASAPSSAMRTNSDFDDVTPKMGIARSGSDGSNLHGRRGEGKEPGQVGPVRLSKIGNAV